MQKPGLLYTKLQAIPGILRASLHSVRQKMQYYCEVTPYNVLRYLNFAEI